MYTCYYVYILSLKISHLTVYTLITNREFRKNLSQYIDLLAEGEVIELKKVRLVHLPEGFEIAGKHTDISETHTNIQETNSTTIDTTCDKCGKKAVTKTHWEEGEEYNICFDCVLLKHGKHAPGVWRRMS